MAGEQVVVITGASAGVGRATARMFAKERMRIGLLARGEAGLEAAKAEVEAAGGRAVGAVTDVADYAQVEAAAARVEDELGPIDIWINNAMATVFSPVRSITPEEFRRVTDTTYLGAVHGTMVALKRMAARNRGTIVQVGSALSYRAIPLQAAYCGAKHALRGFTDSLRCELIHDGLDIRLTMVHLPALNTPQFQWAPSHLPRGPQPLPPIFQPELAAQAIRWAARHDRREVIFGSPTAAVIIGNKLFPRLTDRYLASTGFDSQMSDDPVTPDRPNYLFNPVDRDFGPHGTFGEQASARSLHLWATTHIPAPVVVDAVAGLWGAVQVGTSFFKGVLSRKRESTRDERRGAAG